MTNQVSSVLEYADYQSRYIFRRLRFVVPTLFVHLTTPIFG